MRSAFLVAVVIILAATVVHAQQTIVFKSEIDEPGGSVETANGTYETRITQWSWSYQKALSNRFPCYYLITLHGGNDTRHFILDYNGSTAVAVEHATWQVPLNVSRVNMSIVAPPVDIQLHTTVDGVVSISEVRTVQPNMTRIQKWFDDHPSTIARNDSRMDCSPPEIFVVPENATTNASSEPVVSEPLSNETAYISDAIIRVLALRIVGILAWHAIQAIFHPQG